MWDFLRQYVLHDRCKHFMGVVLSCSIFWTVYYMYDSCKLCMGVVLRCGIFWDSILYDRCKLCMGVVLIKLYNPIVGGAPFYMSCSHQFSSVWSCISLWWHQESKTENCISQQVYFLSTFLTLHLQTSDGWQLACSILFIWFVDSLHAVFCTLNFWRLQAKHGHACMALFIL